MKQTMKMVTMRMSVVRSESKVRSRVIGRRGTRMCVHEFTSTPFFFFKVKVTWGDNSMISEHFHCRQLVSLKSYVSGRTQSSGAFASYN